MPDLVQMLTLDVSVVCKKTFYPGRLGFQLFRDKS